MTVRTGYVPQRSNRYDRESESVPTGTKRRERSSGQERRSERAAKSNVKIKASENGEIVFYLKDMLQTDFTFTGQEINTRLGNNTFWSEQGDTEVTYRRDIDLALQALSGSRGLMMARPPAAAETEETEPEDETTETIEETPEDMEK